MSTEWEKDQAARAETNRIKQEAFRALVTAIAKALGEGFKSSTSKELEHLGEIRHADGRCVNINNSWYSNKGRLNISGDYPKDREGRYSGPRDWGVIAYNETGPSITVNASRAPEAIAKDIKSRFLPEYTRLFNLCLEKRTEREGYRGEEKAKAERILSALGKRIARIVGEPDNTHVDLNYSDAGYGELTNNSVKLNSLPFDVVLEIAAVLAKHSKKGGK